MSVAENERWANNATGEFLTHFQLHLGGTEVPYLDRLPVLDDIWARGPDYHPLVLRSLAQAAAVHEDRMRGAEDRGRGPAPPEWRPTPSEAHAARSEALRLLAQRLREAEVPPETAFEVARGLVWPLSHGRYQLELEAIIGTTVARFPDLRERLRRLFAERLAHAEWQRRETPDKVDLVPSVVATLHERLRDDSLRGRLVERVGPDPWDTLVTAEPMRKLATELVQTPGAFPEFLPWLTSTEASNAYGLGAALADVDGDGLLAERLTVSHEVGPNVSLAVGYFTNMRERRGDAWIDFLTSRLAAQGGQAGSLAFDILARLPPSGARADQLVDLVRKEPVGRARLRVLAHRPWCSDVDDDVFSSLMAALVEGDADSRRGALELLGSRRHCGHPIPQVLRKIALDLVTDRDVYPAQWSEHVWYWREVTEDVAIDDPGRVAGFLLSLQLEAERTYFLAHEPDAIQVLNACVKASGEAVWNELRSLLEPPRWGGASIGFPRTLLHMLPPRPLIEWVDEAPNERASVLAHFVEPRFATDSDLDSQLVERHGNQRNVGNALFASLISGTSVGSLADHWQGVVEVMQRIEARTRLRGLRAWARNARRALEGMIRDERGHEADDEIRRG